jgi:DNA primase
VSIPKTFIDELIARADVVEIVGRYVQLKKGGANFMGLCPFHGEKSPSFSVSPTKQFYHCFGCGKNGDAIRFLMDHTGATFVEAVTDLAQQYGMQVPEDDTSPQERARAAEQREKQATLSDVLEKANQAYQKQLRQNTRPIDYLKNRGLSGQVAKQYGLGYAPAGWRGLASVFPEYDDPLLVESGLVLLNADEDSGEEKRYDRFRDRVMFPIRNIKGECIGFGGRVLGDEKPKYLNSPETPVFSKGRELYGLFEARNAVHSAGFVLVTEGYMDVVALAQLGFPNAVATLGTACTPDHVQKLFRFTDAVVFSFDGDAAGRRAARKALDGALPYATDVRSVKFLFLPAEHDPDSFIRAHGRDAFAQYVAEATPLSKFLVEAAGEGCDLYTAEGRAHMASNAKPLWSLLPDGALKRQMLSEIAGLVQLSSTELNEVWFGRAASAPRSAPPPEEAPSGHHQPQSSWKKNDDWKKKKDGWKPKKEWSKKFGKGEDDGPRQTDRIQPASRADHAVRLLLGHPGVWDKLTGEDHTMLAALPGQYGPLFSWLEGQYHEHGPQPWGVLSEQLQAHNHFFDDLAIQIMSRPDAAPAPPPVPDAAGNTANPAQELANELRALLDLMHIDYLNDEMNALVMLIPTDAEARARYQALSDRRNALRGKGKTPA